MLFRRISEHVKAQNWTAVVLDFFIVVVGVFIGIQVANWNEHLNDGQRAENYRERLITAMEINRQTLLGREASFQIQIDYGLFAVDATAKPMDREAAWQIVRSFFQASHAFTVSLQRGTYDEIINSGDLSLLNDQKLLNALSHFYTFAGYSTVATIPDYRENLRRIIPFPLQQYFQTQCYEISQPDIHILLDCPAPEEFDNLIELATQLQADDELKRDLQYMLSYADNSLSITKNMNKRADALLTILSTNSNSQQR